MNEPIRIHIDGGARGNPGPAGFGVSAADAGGAVVAELYGFLGRATNNVAEYAGLLAALEWARRSGVTRLEIYSDSQLMVRQLAGQYKVRNAGLQPLFTRARRLLAAFPGARVAHVPRAENKAADALANRAMDEAAGNVPSPL
jgi:ribonuclease HI